MDTDDLVWQLFEVRCGLEASADEETRRALREREKHVVAGLRAQGLTIVIQSPPPATVGPHLTYF